MSDCSCVLVCADDCMPSVIDVTTPTARKAHKCTECKGEISPGERYELVKGCWEGQWDTFKTCPTCMAIRENFFCEGYLFGDVMEHLQMHIADSDGEIPESCIVALPEKARAIVFKMIEDVWEDYDD